MVVQASEEKGGETARIPERDHHYRGVGAGLKFLSVANREGGTGHVGDSPHRSMGSPRVKTSRECVSEEVSRTFLFSLACFFGGGVGVFPCFLVFPSLACACKQVVSAQDVRDCLVGRGRERPTTLRSMAGGLLSGSRSAGSLRDLLESQHGLRQDLEEDREVADISGFITRKDPADKRPGSKRPHSRGGIGPYKDGAEESLFREFKPTRTGDDNRELKGREEGREALGAIDLSTEKEIETEEAREGFPPQPPSFWDPITNFIKGARGCKPWRGLLGQNSPMKRLFQPSFNKFGLEVAPLGLDWELPEALTNHKGRKKEEEKEEKSRQGKKAAWPGRVSAFGLGQRKRFQMLAIAMNKAKSLGEEKGRVAEFKKKFSASSSLKPMLARRKTVESIATSLSKETKGGRQWTPELFTNLGTVLKESGYKSAKLYLAEAKLMHIEDGHPWDQQMERVHQQVKRAVERGKGKAKRALEVPAHLWIANAKDKPVKQNSRKRVSEARADLAFALGVHWMLREAELVEMRVEDILLDRAKKAAKVCLKSARWIRRARQSLAYCNAIVGPSAQQTNNVHTSWPGK